MPTTGLAPLPDTGSLVYNGIQFSCLYKSEINGKVLPDDANRTTKVVEWHLVVDGVVTLEANQPNTDSTWMNIRQSLSVQGAALEYSGQGFGGLHINQGNQFGNDVQWGPIPNIISFTPLGQGRSALIKWEMTTWLSELAFSQQNVQPPTPNVGGHILQFNYEAGIKYDEDGYSGLSVHLLVEIPMNRTRPIDRAIQATVDDFRDKWANIKIDLNNFRVTSRDFKISRDKRKLEGTFEAEEMAPAGLPAGATNARGKMSIRSNHHKGKRISGMIDWTCTLTATYTIRSDMPRRTAAWLFWSLLWFRMFSTANSQTTPTTDDPTNAQQQPNVNFQPGFVNPTPGTTPSGTAGIDIVSNAAGFFIAVFLAQQGYIKGGNQSSSQATTQPFLIDFQIEEGLYLDSKTVTFTASWILIVPFRQILRASGIWRYPGDTGKGPWSESIGDIMGSRSWLRNQLNPFADTIVDLGGGDPAVVPVFIPEGTSTVTGPSLKTSGPSKFTTNQPFKR